MTIQKSKKTRHARKILTRKEWSTILTDLQFCQIQDWKTAATIINNRRRVAL